VRLIQDDTTSSRGIENGSARGALKYTLLVWPTIEESSDLDFQIRDVMVGPLDFDAN
jgi:hypothetical protein